jgi:hypothetical protein
VSPFVLVAPWVVTSVLVDCGPGTPAEYIVYEKGLRYSDVRIAWSYNVVRFARTCWPHNPEAPFMLKNRGAVYSEMEAYFRVSTRRSPRPHPTGRQVTIYPNRIYLRDYVQVSEGGRVLLDVPVVSLRE